MSHSEKLCMGKTDQQRDGLTEDGNPTEEVKPRSVGTTVGSFRPKDKRNRLPKNSS